jgi:hypothetical protein
MWVELQATIRCRACGEASAVNGAVQSLPCLSCGAALTLSSELWPNALRDVCETATSLGHNATTKSELEAGSGKLTVSLRAANAQCPHCEAAWDRPSTSCPSCQHAVTMRSIGDFTLVAEDPGLLGGAATVPQTISCSGCGAALVASGASRAVRCEHCNQESVVPDPVWRRIHAPRSVARWYVFREGTLARKQIKVEIHEGLVADAARLYLGGKHDDNVIFGLIALDRRTGELAWSIDLEKHGLQMVKLAIRGTEVFAIGHPTGGIVVFDTATGRELRRFDASMMTQIAPDPDGTVLVFPATQPLHRLGPKGEQVPLWPSAGFLKGLFGGGGPKSLSGEIGMGHDGELRVASMGGQVERRERSGKLRWSIKIPKVHNPSCAPCASSDGTTWAVYGTGGGAMTAEEILPSMEAMMKGTANLSVLVRISADGQDVRVVRNSGMKELRNLAVAPDGEVWVEADGMMFHLDARGELIDQRYMRLYGEPDAE